MSMRIAVVIPAYNAGRYVARAIDSVLAQTRPADQIIVVDDGSTDNTAEAVAAYRHEVRYIRQRNAGASAARNAGIEAAEREWIAFLDADDEWLPEKLQVQSEHLQRNTDLAWTTANFIRCDCDKNTQWDDLSGPRLAHIESMLAGGECFDNYFLAHCSFAGGWTGTMLIRREALTEAGLFRPGQVRINDMDMWFRIAYRRPRIGFITRPLAVYHMGVPASIVKTHKDAAVISGFIDRHLELSARHGCLDAFRPCAAKEVGWWMHCYLLERRGREVRTLLKRYGDLYGGYFRATMLIKSFFPRAGLWYDDLKCRQRRPDAAESRTHCSG